MASANTKLRAIDLFSGCGGLSLGLRRAGFEVAVAVEINPNAAATYRANHPNTRLLETDISTLTSARLLREVGVRRGQLDLLAGCPPCQGFSRMTSLNGRLKNDPRNALIDHFDRLVRGLLPRAVLLENVPALARSTRFRKFLKTLNALGYEVTKGSLDAAGFGVPQRRKRLIVMAVRGVEITLPIGTTSRKTVRQVIGKLPAPRRSSDELHRLVLRNTPRIKQRISKIPTDGGSRSDLGEASQLKCHRNRDGFKDVYGRMHWDRVAPTITSGCFNPSKGRFLHPAQNRAISMREAALLQTFPRSYRFPKSLGVTVVARLLGDALPPRFAERQARQIACALLN